MERGGILMWLRQGYGLCSVDHGYPGQTVKDVNLWCACLRFTYRCQHFVLLSSMLVVSRHFDSVDNGPYQRRQLSWARIPTSPTSKPLQYQPHISLDLVFPILQVAASLSFSRATGSGIYTPLLHPSSFFDDEVNPMLYCSRLTAEDKSLWLVARHPFITNHVIIHYPNPKQCFSLLLLCLSTPRL